MLEKRTQAELRLGHALIGSLEIILGSLFGIRRHPPPAFEDHAEAELGLRIAQRRQIEPDFPGAPVVVIEEGAQAVVEIRRSGRRQAKKKCPSDRE
ncbi:MAG: hypothetical protein CFH39_02336 [Alphaproteobacteria bacterium MarineAlpha10_Bin2]|nr:MAG: hypothetical protein CFH39_02336 [Alphaproteobacteria bacterium MarineAlpha10_Bin2]